MKKNYLALSVIPITLACISMHNAYGLPAKISPPGERLFVFSPRSVSWAAYDSNGNRINQGTANGGSHYCRDIGRSCRTITGTFRVISKGSPGCRSTLYPIKRSNGRIVRGGAPMPYCMFFSRYYAVHGSPSITNANVSHGCVRVSTGAARWLSNSFMQIGTKVKVLSY